MMDFQGMVWIIFCFAVAVTCITVVGFLSWIFYLVYLRKLKYVHIPGPPVKLRNFFTGHLNELIEEPKLRGEPIGEYELKMFLEFGEVILLWIFHIPFVAVCSPALVRDILVTRNYPKSPMAYIPLMTLYQHRFLGSGLVTNMNQQDWKVKRRMMNPAFHRKYLKFMVPEMNACCDILINKLTGVANGRKQVNMLNELSKLTLDIICKVGFGVDLNIILDDDAAFTRAVDIALQHANDSSFRSVMDKFRLRYTAEQKNAIKSVKYLRDIGQKVIQDRQEKLRNGEDLPLDLLTCILKSCEQEDAIISMESLIDEFVTFFFAGHDTTSSLLSFFIMELNDYPSIEEMLVKEMNDVMGDRCKVDFNDLANLQYTSFAIKEILRLHPPVTSAIRVTDQEENIAGYSIPKDTSLEVSFYAASHHPEYYEDPWIFKPERWENYDVEKVSQYTSTPFSVGPRNCIGQTFAQIEAKVILTRLLQKFKFSLVEGQTKAVTERIIARPRDGVICTLRHR